MKVSIAVGGRYHAFDMARQMQNRGFLRILITSYPKYKVRQWNIDRRSTRTVLSHELIARSSRALTRWFGLRLDNVVYLNDRFDKIAARAIPQDTDIFVGWSGMSLHCLRRANFTGAHTVVERNSTHIVHQNNILREEYSNFGLTPDLPPTGTIERELQEYEEADFICVPSTFALKSFVAQGVPESKLRMVSFGVQAEQFPTIVKRDSTFRIIHCGSLTVRKGVHYLLEAFHKLKLPNAELWLVGQSSAEISPFLQKYGGPNVHLKGTFNQSELYKQYSQGSVFCLASIEEGFAMVISQAMACGLPVICTTNTAAHDIIRDGVDGFIVPIRDVEALQSKIALLYEDRDRCHHMGESARRHIISNFTWNHYGQRLASIYSQISATSKSHAGSACFRQ